MREISYFEIKPWRVTLRVAVDPHQEVVLDWTHWNSEVEVAAFEISVESQVLLFHRRVHACKQAILQRSNGERFFLLRQKVKLVFRERLAVHIWFRVAVCFFVEAPRIGLKSFKIGNVSGPHVDNSKLLLPSEGGERFRKIICDRIGEVDGKLLQFARC